MSQPKVRQKASPVTLPCPSSLPLLGGIQIITDAQGRQTIRDIPDRFKLENPISNNVKIVA